MINIQPIEKISNSNMFEVHSIFHTIQGEGPFTGVPAVFLRLAGCNLKCPACDTDYTSSRTTFSAQNILNAVQDYTANTNTKLVVITGGEPFRQRNIGKLFEILVNNGYYVQVETNGTLPPVEFCAFNKTGYLYNTHPSNVGICVYIVVSPKAGKVHPLIWKHACAVKYVVKAGDQHTNGLPLHALDHTASPHVAHPPKAWRRKIYVQPLDEQDSLKNKANLQACISASMTYSYTLQLQIHKIIEME